MRQARLQGQISGLGGGKKLFFTRWNFNSDRLWLMCQTDHAFYGAQTQNLRVSHHEARWSTADLLGVVCMECRRISTWTSPGKHHPYWFCTYEMCWHLYDFSFLQNGSCSRLWFLQCCWNPVSTSSLCNAMFLRGFLISCFWSFTFMLSKWWLDL